MSGNPTYQELAVTAKAECFGEQTLP
jgi:hypothetical protein